MVAAVAGEGRGVSAGIVARTESGACWTGCTELQDLDTRVRVGCATCEGKKGGDERVVSSKQISQIKHTDGWNSPVRVLIP